MRVCIVGAGYVGLVTGVGLAEHGHSVVLVDTDASKVAEINAARPPIFEDGLDRLLRLHVGTLLRADTDLAAAVVASDLTMVCVGTPSRSDGSMDTSALERATAQVGAALRTRPAGPDAHCVVVKSTVLPGTTDGLLTRLLAESSGLLPGVDLGVGANPEFLTEGQALGDFLEPDRIVIGGDDRAIAALRKLYAGFSGVPVVATNARTAEMIKYASNTMLATAISFANEIADLGAAIGDIDVVDVMRGVHASRYLTSPPGPTGRVRAGLAAFYQAGCGYGGSCLPKDVAALASYGRQVGVPTRILDAVAAINAERPGQLVDVVVRGLGGLRGRRVTVLGLAFKPDTDDVRLSPAFPVLRLLLAGGAEVSVHDPVVGPEALAEFGPDVAYVGELAAAVKGADAIVIVTRWDEYHMLPALITEFDVHALVVDGRRMLDPTSIRRYAGVGSSTTAMRHENEER